MPNRNELIVEKFGSIHRYINDRKEIYAFQSFRNKIIIKIYQSRLPEGGKLPRTYSYLISLITDGKVILSTKLNSGTSHSYLYPL